MNTKSNPSPASSVPAPAEDVDCAPVACLMTCTEHVLNEWARLAQSADKDGHFEIEAKFNEACSLPSGHRLPIAEFDALQAVYTSWLSFGWAEAIPSFQKHFPSPAEPVKVLGGGKIPACVSQLLPLTLVDNGPNSGNVIRWEVCGNGGNIKVAEIECPRVSEMTRKQAEAFAPFLVTACNSHTANLAKIQALETALRGVLHIAKFGAAVYVRDNGMDASSREKARFIREAEDALSLPSA